MYRVLCDGLPIYDLRDEELVLFDPKATLEVNTAGSFEFKIPPNHPQYNLPKMMRSCVEIWHDKDQIFAGRPISDSLDFYNRKHVKCEGQLAYLNDSIQRPAEYHDMTVRGYLETLIAIHNQQVDESRQFEVGIVTVRDNNDSLFRYTNYNSTWTEIKEDLIDDLGGYIRVRNHNGHRYIDYIEDFDNVCSQSIEFGENLLDCSRNTDLTDIATAVIPLGCRLEESDIAALEKRLTIESVNNGLDYVVNADAVEKYGFIVKKVTWDNVTTAEMLLSKGKRWLENEQFKNMVIDVKAVDLHYTDDQIEQFKLFDLILVHSTPHGLNRQFPLTKMTINLDNPTANTFVLGTMVNTSLTSKLNAVQSEIKNVMEIIPVPSSIVQQAVAEATALITAATHGHVVTTAEEQLIMDTNDVNTAKRVWRWNLNGFGYSSTGYNGTYKTAITMDGWIVGERIAANSISGDKLDITYKQSVTKEISDAEEAARSDAEGYTDEKLQSYYTISQIETTIKNTQDTILLSAQETAEQYVDGQLKNYATAAQIKIEMNSINAEVSKKVGNASVISAINQSAEEIKIQASKISLEGIITANGNVKIDEAGNITVKNGTFGGDVIASSFTAYGGNNTLKAMDSGVVMDTYYPSNDVTYYREMPLKIRNRGNYHDVSLEINPRFLHIYGNDNFAYRNEQYDYRITLNRGFSVGSFISCEDLYTNGAVHLQSSGSTGQGTDIYGGVVLRELTTALDDIYVESGADICMFSGSNIQLATDSGIYSGAYGISMLRMSDYGNYSDMIALGHMSRPVSAFCNGHLWKNGSSTTYFQEASSSSDRRLKTEVSDLSCYEPFFMNLKPVAFRYHDGLYNAPKTEPLIQWGFYAQDVIKAFGDNGLNWESEGFAVVEDAGLTEQEQTYIDDGKLLKLGYQNMIALNTHMIQILYREIKNLSRKETT